MASLALDIVDEKGLYRPVRPVSLPSGSRTRVVALSLDAPSITKTAGICGGRERIAGTRITVWGLVSHRSHRSHRNLGLDERAILAAVPLLTSDQLSAAFRYAHDLAV